MVTSFVLKNLKFTECWYNVYIYDGIRAVEIQLENLKRDTTAYLLLMFCGLLSLYVTYQNNTFLMFTNYLQNGPFRISFKTARSISFAKRILRYN